jgi:hypothetical protein
MRRIIIWLALWTGSLPINLLAARIEYQVTSVDGTPASGSLFRYTYLLSDIIFEANQELDIRFDPDLYGALSNATAGAGFDVLLFQPNNPPGVFGNYTAFALVDDPSLAEPFSVEFVFLGTGAPGAQPFFVNQYDPGGSFLFSIESGLTTPAGGAPIPEPAGFSLGGVGLLVIVGWWAVRRRSGGTAW